MQGGRKDATASVLGAISFAIEPSLGQDGYYHVDGLPACRARVVDTVTAALAGREMSADAYAVSERTAARVVREVPGPLPAHEEIRASAEVAW